jgi:hypothetical protein
MEPVNFPGLGPKFVQALFQPLDQFFSPISMQTLFPFYTFSNLNANSMVETKLGKNFGPKPLGN